MTKPTSAQSLVGFPVAHFGHLSTLNCLNFTWNDKRLEETVNSEGKKHLGTFFKRVKSCALLLHQNCSKPP